MERAHLDSKLAYAALATILALLFGMGIASAFVTQASARVAAAAATRAALFASARFEIGAEESFEHKYRYEPAPDVLAAHAAAEQRLVRALEFARTTPGQPIGALIDRLLIAHRRYVKAWHRMAAAAAVHKLDLFASIDQHEADPAFSALQAGTFDEAALADNAANEALAKLLQTEHVVLVVTLSVSFVAILALLGIFKILRRYKTQVDRVVANEIDLLKAATLTDYLTGLGNHRAYQESFGDRVAECRLSGEPLTIALVDVDEFKVLNDRRGHVAGDRLLAALAKVLRSEDVRSIPYRLGGDEFALSFVGMPAAVARIRMEEVRAIVEAELGGATVSIGLTTMTALDDDPLVLREQADAALYEAKRRGRNTIVSFDEIRSEAMLFSPARVAQVRRLIETAEIGVAFQPIWNVDGRSVLGYEALARPQGEDPINPQDAFDIAETIGKAHELDRVCRDAIFRTASTLPPGARLFINVSPQSLDHDVFAGTSLLDAVALAGLTPGQIVLEITERSVARLPVVVREAQRLRALGFALALDDAGSGNSGLEMLSQLDVDYVKIDRDVIVRAQSRGGGRGVLAGIVAIAHEMGARIIAEGIEDAEMLDLVMRATHSSSIPAAVQGYFLGRPSTGFVDAVQLALVEDRLAASDFTRPQKIGAESSLITS